MIIPSLQVRKQALQDGVSSPRSQSYSVTEFRVPTQVPLTPKAMFSLLFRIGSLGERDCSLHRSVHSLFLGYPASSGVSHAPSKRGCGFF